MLRWVGWNLFLAAIPVVLGYAVAWGLKRRGKDRNLPLWVTLPLALVWLVFLPNTCYLLTEWRHLLYDEHWIGLLDAGQQDPGAMLSTAKWALFFVVYSGVGVLLFALAIRPMEHWLRAARVAPYVLAPFFFLLMSLGVYLGLRVRLNSWDLFNRPSYVWQFIVGAVTNTTLIWAIAVFAVVLWVVYECVDIWVDGVADRLRRLGVLAPAKGGQG